MAEEINIEKIKAELQCETCGWYKICADSSRTINYKTLREKQLTECDAWKPLEAEKKTLTLKLTLPTADDVKAALIKLFPGIEITVQDEVPGETLAIKEDEAPQ